MHIEANNCQDSFLEARLFAFHNHLFKNPYDSSCWFIDKVGGIWKFLTDGSLDLIYTSKIIGQNHTERIYNPSIEFAEKDIIVVCDGNGALEILIQDNNLVKNYYADNIEPGVVVDARYSEEDSKIIVSLYKIDEIIKNDKSKKVSRLIFLYYNLKKNIANESSKLELIQKQTLKVKGVIENVYVDVKGKFCYIISQDQVEFDYDSLKAIEDRTQEKNSQIKIPKYCWSQDEESITIYVKISEKYKNVLPKVETSSDSLLVMFDNDILLNGRTPHRLESNLTTWNCKNGFLEIELSKAENGLMWNELILGDTGGEYLPNQALATEIHER